MQGICAPRQKETWGRVRSLSTNAPIDLVGRSLGFSPVRGRRVTTLGNAIHRLGATLHIETIGSCFFAPMVLLSVHLKR